MQYPLCAKAVSLIYNQSVLSMHGHFCTPEELAGQLAEVGLPTEVTEIAELRLLADPSLLRQIEQSCSCEDPQVELMLAGWCKYVGLD
jgi:hypothetical protein